jgi:hypothetical protein
LLISYVDSSCPNPWKIAPVFPTFVTEMYSNQEFLSYKKYGEIKALIDAYIALFTLKCP